MSACGDRDLIERVGVTLAVLQRETALQKIIFDDRHETNASGNGFRHGSSKHHRA